jgi:hypothetical protein
VCADEVLASMGGMLIVTCPMTQAAGMARLAPHAAGVALVCTYVILSARPQLLVAWFWRCKVPLKRFVWF